ncbi:Fur family transcriptional regulator [Bartonella sp. CB169]|uniref:Fur family transcriptional regulator n=1 Tax=Bartonella sp. CB169 TaxID=3112257 RepID=UPI00300E5C43
MNVVLVVQRKNTNTVMEPSFKKIKIKKMNKKRNYEQDLRAAGLRVTRPRRIILDILTATNDHPNAFEIFQRAHKIDSSISLSTVYRTMKTLEGNGTIHRHTFSGGPSRFEQADRQHHDHLIDVETEQVIEFQSDVIEKLQEEIAKSLGYDIIHHRLELYGKKQKS